MQSIVFDFDRGLVDLPSSARMQSRLIKNFPWYNAEILSTNDLASLLPSGHEAKPFLNAVVTAEKTINWASQLRPRTAGYETNTITALAADALHLYLQPRAKQYESDNQCSILACYRLVEVLIQTSEMLVTLPPPWKKKSYLGSAFKEHWEKALQDWPRLITKFSENLGKVKNNQIPMGMAGLNALFQLDDSLACLKVISNINITVLYLRYLLQGNIAFREGASVIIQMHPTASQTLVDKFSKKGLSDKAIKGPLEECLLISPLLIFSNSNRCNARWKRCDLVEAARGLGNEKPQDLLAVEMKIWKILQKMALGDLNLIEGCQSLAQVLKLTTIDSTGYFRSSELNVPVSTPQLPPAVMWQPDDQARPIQHFQDSTMDVDSKGPYKDVDEDTTANLEPHTDSQAVHAQGRPSTTVSQTSSASPKAISGNATDISDMDLDLDGGAEVLVENLRKRSREGVVPKTRLSSRVSKRVRMENENKTLLDSSINIEGYELLTAPEPKISLKNKKGFLATPETFTVYDPVGTPHNIQQIYHHEPSRESFVSIMTASSKFSNGEAVHLSSPDKSAFHVLTEAEYNHEEPGQILEILRQKHIVIRDCHFETFEFDKKGLGTLARLDRVVNVQDHSTPLAQGLHDSDCLQFAMLKDILEAAEGNNKRILNALNFPLPLIGILENKFASEYSAWVQTEGLPMCKLPFPAQDVRWGLAATKGALHGGHIDSDGFGTYIDVIAGCKVWVMGHPKGPNYTNIPFSNPKLFDNFDNSVPNEEKWDLHAIVLPTGTRLIMRPNTPHFVYTPQHAICHGGHFYGMSTMQDTLAGVIHDFVHHQRITNTEHSPSRLLLIRLGIFIHKHLIHTPIDPDSIAAQHIPSLQTFSSVLDLFSALILSSMSEIFDWDTYSGSGVDPKVLPMYQHARGAAYEALNFFFENYLIRDAQGALVNAMKDIHVPMLIGIIKALVSMKKSAPGQDGVFGCTLTALKREISNWIVVNPYIDLTLNEILVQDLGASLAWSGSMDYTVQPNPQSTPSTPKTTEELMGMGNITA